LSSATYASPRREIIDGGMDPPARPGGDGLQLGNVGNGGDDRGRAMIGAKSAQECHDAISVIVLLIVID